MLIYIYSNRERERDEEEGGGSSGHSCNHYSSGGHMEAVEKEKREIAEANATHSM